MLINFWPVICYGGVWFQLAMIETEDGPFVNNWNILNMFDEF